MLRTDEEERDAAAERRCGDNVLLECNGEGERDDGDVIE